MLLSNAKFLQSQSREVAGWKQKGKKVWIKEAIKLKQDVDA